MSGEGKTLTNGGNMQVRRRLATAGQIVVDFANTFTWRFAGANTNTATSLLGFSIVQPLLRSGGRVVGLEQLTRAERNLLGNLRAFQRYRKGFYTDMAIGSRGTGGSPRRSGGFFGGQGLTGFPGQGSGGFGGVHPVSKRNESKGVYGFSFLRLANKIIRNEAFHKTLHLMNRVNARLQPTYCQPVVRNNKPLHLLYGN